MLASSNTQLDNQLPRHLSQLEDVLHRYHTTEISTQHIATSSGSSYNIQGFIEGGGGGHSLPLETLCPPPPLWKFQPFKIECCSLHACPPPQMPSDMFCPPLEIFLNKPLTYIGSVPPKSRGRGGGRIYLGKLNSPMTTSKETKLGEGGGGGGGSWYVPFVGEALWIWGYGYVETQCNWFT